VTRSFISIIYARPGTTIPSRDHPEGVTKRRSPAFKNWRQAADWLEANQHPNRKYSEIKQSTEEPTK